jgi:hypothetical protein
MIPKSLSQQNFRESRDVDGASWPLLGTSDTAREDNNRHGKENYMGRLSWDKPFDIF